MEEGLEYKHTKRLIQAYCIIISTPSLISAYNQLLLILILLLLLLLLLIDYYHLHISASQYLSSSAFPSLSVGSIIKVLATGHDTVGAWNPEMK